MVEKGFPKKISKLAVDLHDHQYWDVQAHLMLANVGQTLGHYETHEATIQLLNSAHQWRREHFAELGRLCIGQR